METIYLAEKSLDTALRFFEGKKVALSYKPELEYSDKILSVKPDAILLAKQAFYTTIEGKRPIMKEWLKNLFMEGFNLEISDEAAEQFVDIASAKTNRFFKEKLSSFEGDIILFPPFLNVKSDKESDEYVVHEVWHLIEAEKSVLGIATDISEGTATYAMKSFSGKGCDKTVEELEDFEQIIYQGAGNIVQKHVQKSENPYTSMLISKVREDIREEFLGRVKPVLKRIAKKSIEDESPESMKVDYELLMGMPEFQSLKGNLSKDELIKAFRRYGAAGMAEELDGQNMNSLINYFRKIGFE